MKSNTRGGEVTRVRLLKLLQETTIAGGEGLISNQI